MSSWDRRPSPFHSPVDLPAGALSVGDCVPPHREQHRASRWDETPQDSHFARLIQRQLHHRYQNEVQLAEAVSTVSRLLKWMEVTDVEPAPAADK